MHLIPNQEEVVSVLRDTGALRDGHFEYSNGLHSNEYLQVALAMRYSQHQRMMTGGLPVAYGVCEALRARQVYWAERENDDEPLHFRQFVVPEPGEPVVLVDDILRTGTKLAELKELLEKGGANVVGLAVMVYQPTPNTQSFGNLPLYYLAKLDASYAVDGAHCEWCRKGVPVEKVWI
jgi:orotate phosphoribosyltransferase